MPVSDNYSLMTSTLVAKRLNMFSSVWLVFSSVEFVTTNHNKFTYAVKHMHCVVSIEELCMRVTYI